jgi:glutaredoxin-related protein
MSKTSGLVVISTECTNCARLLDTLKRIPDHGLVIVDYSTLTPMQRVGLTAVPTLIKNDGKRVVGTDVFEYINATYYQRMEISGFDGLDSEDLMFSSISDPIGGQNHDHSYAFLDSK